MSKHGFFTKWIRLVIAAVVGTPIVMALSPLTPVEATTTLVPQTTFVIDGNSAGPDDFEAPYGPGLTPGGLPTTGLYYDTRTVDFNGNPCGADGDDQGLGGSKAEDGPVWPEDPAPTSPPNGKSDLEDVWLAAEKVDVNGTINDILYVGYLSCDGGQGSFSTLLFVDDGDGLLPSQGDNGDYMFRFDFNPNNGTATFTMYRRIAGSWQTQAIPAGAIEGKSGGAGDFGEVALNLTALNILPSGECRTIDVGGQTATITGGSLQSQPKDLVEVEPLTISTCGALNVVKAANPATLTSPDLFHYIVDRTPAGPVHDTTLDVTGVTGTTEPDGNVNEVDATIIVGETDAWKRLISQPNYKI